MNRAAEVIKESLSMPEVVERYGFQTNRAGFVRCPFHSGDNSASLKIYPEKGGGFFCFGCQASGSVIDFVMKLFECSFTDACKRLSDDFGLGLYQQSYRERKASRDAFMAKRRAAREREAAKDSAEKAYWDAFDRWVAADKVTRTGDPFSDEWAEAVKSLPQLSYELTLAEERRREFDKVTRYS